MDFIFFYFCVFSFFFENFFGFGFFLFLFFAHFGGVIAVMNGEKKSFNFLLIFFGFWLYCKCYKMKTQKIITIASFA